MKINKLSKSFFFIISLGLCLYQICKICEIYFSYKTTISLSFQNSSLVSLPAITVCIKKTKVFRKDFLQRLLKNRTEIDNKHDLINSIPIEEQIRHMLTYDEIIGDNCRVLKPIGVDSTEDYIDCRNVSGVRQSMSYYSICYTYFHQRSDQSEDKFNLIRNDFTDLTPFILNITLDNNTVNHLHLYLHSRNELLVRTPLTESLEHRYQKDFCDMIAYNKKVVETLPKPYETECFDYNTIGFNSREDCIQKCRIDELTQEFEGWPGDYLLYDITKFRFIYDLWSTLPKKNKSLDKLIGNKCKEICDLGTECRKQVFEVKAIKFPTGDRGLIINIAPPTSPDLLTRHSPKLIFEEFVSFIGSLIGLYFGFSVMMLTDVCSLAVSYCFNRLQINSIYFVQKSRVTFIKPEVKILNH